MPNIVSKEITMSRRNKKNLSKKNSMSVDKLSELPEADQDNQLPQGNTFHQSEPAIERESEREVLATSVPERQRTRLKPVTEYSKHKYRRDSNPQVQPIAIEHLVCCICGVEVRRSDLYMLSCCHSVCLGCVRIEEGYYKCPNDSCVVVASVQYGELRANLLSRDYKKIFEQTKRGEKRGTGSKQEAHLCENCFSSQSLAATHLCMECDRLLCHVCIDLHNRGDGYNHLVLRLEDISCLRIEQLMADMQHRLGACRKHGSRALAHFCTECDAFLCDGCLVEEHRQHITTTIETRLSEIKDRFLSHIRSSYTYTIDMQTRRDTLRDMLDRSISDEVKLVQEITEVYEEIVRRVELKRDELIHKTWSHFSRSKREINIKIQQLDREINQLVRANTYLTSSAQLCSVRTLEENNSHLIQPCSLQHYITILSRELPLYNQLKLKLTGMTERAIKDSGTLVTALNYSSIKPDLVISEVICRPYGVVTDSMNRLLIADGPGKCIRVYRGNNKVCDISDITNIGYPWGIAYREDSIYVTDGVKHSVNKYSLDGTFLSKAGLLGDGKEELNNPMGISCGKMVYVCDSGNKRLQVWSPDLEWKSSIGQGKLEYPRDVSITSEEMLVVLDEGNPCLHIYNIKGNLVGNYGTRGPNKTLVNPFFIATDGEGGILVSDYGADTLKVLSLSDGKVSYTLNSRNLTGVDVTGPNGVSVDSKGRVLLCCAHNRQLIRFYFDK
ncbi:tripartite motif-containing protein 2-like [Oopsacas minuta]|uniref:Tripartite motif-containing protein 2-like n=1 Tax=Oopsacas minuta TaxID=111878 RepID=A0AAV7KCU8_9METZ|nr:tripartite motif-containing protein 2-like [Oopsacas minuta]